MNFDRESADEFLDKAERVQKQVQDILDGKIDLDELEKEEKDEAFIKEQNEALALKKKEDLMKAGKSGKGHQGGYISYCSHCQIEYKMFFKKCNHCNRDTQDEEVS